MSGRRIREKINDNEQRADEGGKPKFSTRIESAFDNVLAFIQLSILAAWIVCLLAFCWAVVPPVFWALFMKYGG